MSSARAQTFGVAVVSALSWLGLATWLGYMVHAQASFNAQTLEPSRLGERIPYSGTRLVEYRGWSFAENGYRWSSGKEASMTVKLTGPVPAAGTDRLRMRIRSANTQLTAMVWVNQCKAGQFALTGSSEEVTLTFDAHCLRSEERNTVLLELPNARPPGNGELRFLGIALEWFSIEAAAD